ncbi:MAG: sulfite exporter TauE/SafE family protein [Chloroflexota bacterium]|nr:sulfite exporter TauE/SafE family protein [Chloroflexota bacterium]
MSLSPTELVVIPAAGLLAGMVNTIVGSGSLITFPTLLAFGYPPVIANVSNTIGLVPGSISGAIGYRAELGGQSRRAIRLGVVSVLGGLSGAALLLVLPPTLFQRVVPFLILTACLLVAIQPRLSRALVAQRRQTSEDSAALFVLVYLTGIYGGYFGAAQGVILIALLTIFVNDDIQRLNGLKNVLTVLINGVAAVVFIALADVAWGPVVLLAIGGIAGGQLGALVGRRMSAVVLRAIIVVVGTIVALRLLAG